MGHVLNLLVRETAVCNTAFQIHGPLSLSGSVKGGKFLNYPKDYSFFKKELYCLESGIVRNLKPATETLRQKILLA
jgi:hypothetical protein